jgi:excisionase family DNA binding protein
MTDKLAYRPVEVAEAIGVSRSTAYELIANGTIPSVQVGGCVRVTVEALKTFLGLQTPTAPEAKGFTPKARR